MTKSGSVNKPAWKAQGGDHGTLPAQMQPHNPRPLSCFVWAGLVVALVGCEGGKSFPGRSDTVIDVSDALELTSDSLLYDIRDAYIDRKNQIWILSEFPPFVHVFSSEGRVRRIFGSQGPGPGELRMPWHFVTASDSSEYVGIWDGGRRQIVRFNDNGDYLGYLPVEVSSGPVVLPFRSISFGEPGKVAGLPSGYVVDSYNGQVMRTMDLWKGRVSFVDRSGRATGKALAFADLVDAVPTGPKDQVFSAVPLWTVCQDGTTHILNPDSSRIHVLTPDGTLSEAQQVEIPSIPLTEEDIRRYVSLRLTIVAREERVDTSSPETRRVVESTVRDLKAQLPRNAPLVRIRCDEVNRIWIELFATNWDARGYSGKWMVLDGDKRFFVRFPPRFHALYFGRQAVAGAAVTDLDVEIPAVFRYPSTLTR
jgi:hypothetical protein